MLRRSSEFIGLFPGGSVSIVTAAPAVAFDVLDLPQFIRALLGDRVAKASRFVTWVERCDKLNPGIAHRQPRCLLGAQLVAAGGRVRRVAGNVAVDAWRLTDCA